MYSKLLYLFSFFFLLLCKSIQHKITVVAAHKVMEQITIITGIVTVWLIIVGVVIVLVCIIVDVVIVLVYIIAGVVDVTARHIYHCGL